MIERGDPRADARAAATVELDVPARMRDGTTLRANVYRPNGSGPWPTLLARLPYGKDGNHELTRWLDPIESTRRGFMVVVQDTRGRGASDGSWSPFACEGDDGYDTVEWAARLPGSNGRVGMYGASYFGNTQWTAARERPPSLAAIAPALTWAEPLDGLLARGGACELAFTVGWSLVNGLPGVSRLPSPEREQRLEALLTDVDRFTRDAGRQRSASDWGAVRRHGLPAVDGAAVAGACRVAGAYERVTVPSFQIGGWYDCFLQGSLDNYVGMASRGRPARLVVGPWAHDLQLADSVGQRCFGIRSSGLGLPLHPDGDLNGLQRAWLGRQLTGTSAQQRDDEPPVRIFVMGRNEWRDETAWPLPRARDERWFLGSDGSLRRDPPGAHERPTELAYDPADPVPTLGGNTLPLPSYAAGPFDQGPVEQRPDVLVFSSAPLERDLEVTGRVRVVLHAASSTPSADWIARLCDVHPDGRSYNVCDGIRRVERGADGCQRIEVDLWSTSNVFLAGHRLRVQVTSSCFPRWDRTPLAGSRRMHHDAERPSWIALPIVR